MALRIHRKAQKRLIHFALEVRDGIINLSSLVPPAQTPATVAAAVCSPVVFRFTARNQSGLFNPTASLIFLLPVEEKKDVSAHVGGFAAQLLVGKRFW